MMYFGPESGGGGGRRGCRPAIPQRLGCDGARGMMRGKTQHYCPACRRYVFTCPHWIA
jgi:hypothetical protein